MAIRHQHVLTPLALLLALAVTTPAAAQGVDLDIATGGTDQTWAGTSANAIAGFWFDLGPVGAGDSRKDLIIGAPGFGSDPGHVYVIFGGPVRSGNNLLSDANVVFNGGPGADRFGSSTAAGNVLATTGPRDLLIGAPSADANKGRVYLYRGGFTGGQVLGTAAARATIVGRPGDRIGTALGTADLNNDGFRELIIGAGGSDRVYVINGSAGLSGTIDLSAVTPAVTMSGDSLGDAVAAGDVTGDGIYDLVLGARLAAGSTGRVYLVKGRAAGLPATMNLDTAADAILSGIATGDNAGTSVELGDFDADGTTDMLIGAPGNDGPGGSRGNSGASYVVWGGASLSSRSLAAADVTIYGAAGGDLAGTQGDAGDVNRDTPNDILVLSAGANAGKGKIFVIYGRSRSRFGSVVDLATTYDRSLYNSAPEGQIGNTVVFEVTGEGARDIIVSHPWATTSAGGNAGKVYFSLSPKLEPRPKTITMNGAPGVATNTTIEVRNPGSGTVPWTVTSQTSWLTVSPASGTSTSSSTPSFTLTASGGSLDPGSYTGTVRVTSTTDHLDMFVTLNVTFNVNTQVSRVADVDGDGTPDATPAVPRYVVGLGPMPGAGGWMELHAGADRNYGLAAWARTPWGAYNGGTGETYPAVGDVDGDGLDELVIGLGPASGGRFVVLDDDQHDYAVLKWITLDWGYYNSINGATYPAVGDIDGDGRAEIVIGLGSGAGGWFRIYDDAAADFAPLRWGRVQWDHYNANGGGDTHPATGDLNGDGRDEIILGLGQGGGGWVEILASSAGNYAHQSWIRTGDAAYNGGNGIVWPAAGDIDNDGRDEIVLGLGRGGKGKAEVRDDANGGYASVRWLQTGWTPYDNEVGEMHPAVGNIDGDAAEEIMIGLGPYGNGGWYLLFNDGTAGNALLGWKRVQWGAFCANGGSTFLAIGRMR